MGTYNNSEVEIVNALSEALSNIEGDFDKKTLFKALEKCKEYPYVTDYDENKLQKLEDKWENYLSSN